MKTSIKKNHAEELKLIFKVCMISSITRFNPHITKQLNIYSFLFLLEANLLNPLINERINIKIIIINKIPILTSLYFILNPV